MNSKASDVSLKPALIGNDGPAVIFLSPRCAEDIDGRQWCEHDVWEECGEPGCECRSVRYVRHDRATLSPPLPSLEVERLRGLLAKIQENGRRLPWQLWTSCSFRRIKTGHLIDDRGDGLDVLSGYRCSDGVVDLSMPEEQLQALVELLNALPAALSALPLDGGLSSD